MVVFLSLIFEMRRNNRLNLRLEIFHKVLINDYHLLSVFGQKYGKSTPYKRNAVV